MKWNQMIPEFDVFNLKESLHFYIDLIGFNVVYERIEDKFAFIEFENVQIMLQEINKSENKWETAKLEYPLGRGINFQIDVINIDKIYNKLKEKNFYKELNYKRFINKAINHLYYEMEREEKEIVEQMEYELEVKK